MPKINLFTGNAVIGPRYLLEITQRHTGCSKPMEPDRTRARDATASSASLPDSEVRSQSIGGTGSDNHPFTRG